MTVKYSIIIPTRNRASLLVHALRSALAQTFDDYEVIVSNNASSDDTEQVVKGFGDPRITYYRTPEAMSMVDHWEFVMGKALGRWVLYLCDDDALVPHCLSTLDALTDRHAGIGVFQYATATYFYDDGLTTEGNYLRYRNPPLRRVQICNSARRLRAVYHSLSGAMPKLLNAAVSMDLVARIKGAYGRIFHNWAPDYTAGILLLAETRHFALVHDPLMLWGNNLRSYGSGAMANPARLAEFLGETRAFQGRFVHSPYPELVTVHNALYDTFCATRALLGGDRDDLVVNACLFRRRLLRDVDTYLRGGHREYLPFREAIGADLRTLPWSSRYGLWGARISRGLQSVQSTVTLRSPGCKRSYGKDGRAKFGNISEAAASLGSHLRGPQG